MSEQNYKTPLNFDKDGVARHGNIFFLKKGNGGIDMATLDRFMKRVEKELGKESFMGIDIARIMDAMFACGSQKALEDFKKTDFYLNYQNILVNQLCVNENAGLRIAHWLVKGNVGLSSLSLAREAKLFDGISGSVFFRLGPSDTRISEPSDMQDIDRCLSLIKLFPDVKNTLLKLSMDNDNWKACLDESIRRTKEEEEI